MRWNRNQRVERPEYPKLLPVAGTAEDLQKLLSAIAKFDPDATILDGGQRGTYIKVHNPEAEAAAKAEPRTFPLN